jgi:ATP-dependent helicase/nuclease subunit A
MNLHKAKGLEAAVVFLADPLKDTDHGPELHIDRLGDEAIGYFVASTESGKWSTTVVGIPPEWQAMEDLEMQYTAAEEERLLYVATTRAKQLLVVSLYPSSPGKGALKRIEPYMTGVEELQTQVVPVKLPKLGVVTREKFEEAKAGREQLLGWIRVPSYRYDTVTGVVETAPGPSPFRTGDGMGKRWGSAIHKTLEIMIEDESVDLGVLSRAVLEQQGIPVSEEDTMVQSLRTVRSSSLWSRMKESLLHHTEIPFALTTDDANQHIVGGKIDLVFRVDEGWVIVDFKSDNQDGNLDELVVYYSRQLKMYREFWEQITGEAVKEAGIYFLDAGVWMTI